MKTNTLLGAVVLVGVLIGGRGEVAAAENMPVGQQNALIQRHCAVCHTDAARNGGLTLQHFDAAHVDPSLAAMLVSRIHGGAVGADGKPTPDKATIAALTEALTSEAAGAEDWYLSGGSSVSALRRVGSSLYRLVVSCKPETGEGSMQLSWAPSPVTGTLTASADGAQAIRYKVEGSEKMGNGMDLTLNGRAAVELYQTGDQPGAKMPLPAKTLTIAELWPGETVTFAFGAMPQPMRQSVAGCFVPR